MYINFSCGVAKKTSMKFPYEILVVAIIFMHAVECQIKKCPDGYKNTGGRMNPNCVACGPGWADSPNSQNSCLMCGPGLFSPNEWNVACSSCAPGFFPTKNPTQRVLRVLQTLSPIQYSPHVCPVQ